MPKVSVIVPVYNGADHLRQHVAGLLKQTLEDIEIIFVNDASTDDTWNVLRAINYLNPEKYRIINSDRNRGAGGARNLGIAAALGEYIGFADCDDDVAPTMFERLYNEAKNGDYDIVSCSFVDGKRGGIGSQKNSEYVGIGDSGRRSIWIAQNGYGVTNIFRRKLFEDDNVFQRENVTLEDADFITYMYAIAGSFGVVADALYKYNTPESASSQMKDIRKYSHNIMSAMQAVYDKVSTLPYYREIQKSVEYFITFMYLNCIKYCLAILSGNISKKSGTTVRNIVFKLISLKKQLVAYSFDDNDFCKLNFRSSDKKLMGLLENKRIDNCLSYINNEPNAIEL